MMKRIVAVFLWIRFNWMPQIFERCGFGDVFEQSLNSRRQCQNETDVALKCPDCGRCEGPFPFASGFLIVLGRELSAEIVRLYIYIYMYIYMYIYI